MVTVSIASAVICFANMCHPALVGHGTPLGEFQLRHVATRQAGYGGDIMVFKEDTTSWWAVHRVLNVKGQHRFQRIRSSDARQRQGITDGCINVDAVVYQELVDCCSTQKMEVVLGPMNIEK
jgi:hypothetical protein